MRCGERAASRQTHALPPEVKARRLCAQARSRTRSCSPSALRISYISPEELVSKEAGRWTGARATLGSASGRSGVR
jgi:hypothetical protein